jgi:two-component system, NarL family, nitrate/nitrite response regulator NarL
MSPVIRLMLVDDHPLVRDGLRLHLQSVPGLAVVAEAADADEALAQAQVHRPDLVLMDVGLRGMGLHSGSGLQATRLLREHLPECKVLVLTMYDNPEYLREAERAGAAGYVLKDSPAQDIVQAIRAVAAGERYFSATVLEKARAQQEASPLLTPRENEVLALVAQGLSSKDIGERLGMGVRTVETHRTNLRRKLKLGSPAALVRYAVEKVGGTASGTAAGAKR